MWCRHCHQETPALGPAGATGPRCGRCQRTSPPTEAVLPQPQAEAGGSPHPEDARCEVYRTLRSAHATIAGGEAARTLRHDVEHTPLAEALGAPHSAPVKRSPAPPPTPRVAPQPAGTARGQLIAWFMASFGASLLGLGIGLGVWSLFGDRPTLWNPALAAAIGGQGLLIVGLLQLLASLWNAARLASGKLSLMHDELRRLRRTAEAEAGRRHASAAAFYADLTRDAPPEMLVGNLRGQLDRLASRLRS